MTQAQWQWEHFGSESRMPGTAAKDGMDDTSFTVAELMAREITQNSDDAMDAFREGFPEHKPRLTYRFIELVGAEKQEFVKRLNLQDLREHSENIVEPREDGDDDHLLRDKTCLKTLDDPDVPIRLLYVEEQGALGLVGDPGVRARKSRWFNALRSLGVSEHSGTSKQSGGTYGFGKAAFQLGSKLGLVVAYSNLYVAEDDDPVDRRLGGYIYQRTHEDADGTVDYSGFAEFGETFQSDGSGRRVQPFTNEQADEWASWLGMSREGLNDGVNQYGTTFLLVDPAAEPNDLLTALEDFWWPALVSNALSLVVINYDGEKLNPRPRRRRDLEPFLKSWSIVTGKAAPTGRYERKQPFNRLTLGDGKTVALGTLAAVADPDTCFEVTARPEGHHASRIALIRRRRMVVQYAPFFENREPYVDGVLFADPEIDTALANAEPKEHNMWWLPTGKAIEKASASQRLIVETLYQRCRAQLSDFRSKLRPDVDEDQLRLDRLSRKLGDLLKVSGRRGKPRPPKGTHGPVSISIPNSRVQRERAEDGRLFYRAAVSLTLADESIDELEVRFKGLINLVEDVGRHGDAIDVFYESVPKRASVKDGELTVRLSGKPCSFILRSAPLDGPYSVEIGGEVTAEVPAKPASQETAASDNHEGDHDA